MPILTEIIDRKKNEWIKLIMKHILAERYVFVLSKEHKRAVVTVLHANSLQNIHWTVICNELSTETSY